MDKYYLLLVFLGISCLIPLIQIFFKRWLFQLGQIKHLKRLMFVTGLVMLVMLVFSDYFGLYSDRMYIAWILWLLFFVLQKEMTKVSYDILAQYLIEHPIGVFVAKHQDAEGRIWGRLEIGDLSMTAVAFAGKFTFGNPCTVIAMVDLDNYGDMKEIQVISLED